MKFPQFVAATALAVVSGIMPARAAGETESSTTPTLSLEQCVEIALSDNPSIKVADLEVTRVDYNRKDVLAQLLPSVSFGVSYNRMLAKQVAYMNLGKIPGMGGTTEGDSEDTSSKKSDQGFKMGLDNSWQMGFSAQVPLIAPQLWASLDLSDSQIAQSVEQARASRLDLANQVRAAYYQLMLARDSKVTIRESYDMAALTHDIYTKQQSVGAASEYDVLRTSVAMKNIEPELLQSDIAVRQAMLRLKILMGLPADFDFDIAGRLADYQDSMYADALDANPDYSANTTLVMNTLQTRTLEQSARVARMAFYPTLALTANYNWTSSSDGNPFANFRWNPYSVVGLTLNVPLYQGGARWNKVKQAEVQLHQLELTRQDLVRSVDMQVQLAIDNINLNVRQIASSTESVGQAERAYDIMQRSFDIGAASYLDLRDSELALTRSRLAYYQSIYNYLIARNDLRLLLGQE